MLYLLLWTCVAFATQDDVRLPLDPPSRWLPEDPGITALPALGGVGSMGVYPVGGPVHVWHGRGEFEAALIGFSRDTALTGGFSSETVADARNSIDFRLVRLFYEATLGVRQRLGPGVAHVGFRHRCSHGVDDAVPDRILIRSGPTLGWRGLWDVSRWTLQAGGDLEWTLIGQNPDTTFQPRGLLDGVGSAQVRLSDSLSWTTAAGLGGLLVGRDAEWWWGPSAPLGRTRVVALPTVATGPVVHGRGGDARLLLHAQRLADSGVGETAAPQVLVAIRLELSPGQVSRSPGADPPLETSR